MSTNMVKLQQSRANKTLKRPFYLEFFRILSGMYSKENLVSSPYSVGLSVTLFIFTAKKAISAKIRDVLELKGPDFDVASDTYNAFKNCRIFPMVDIALNIFANIQYQFRPGMENVWKLCFKVKPEYVDFAKDNQAAEHINFWAKYRTEGKMRNITKHTTFDAGTSLVLCSVACLNARWRIPFDQEKTSPDLFFPTKHTTMWVNMMCTKGEFLTGDLDELNASAVQLGFEDSDLSMVIFMSKDKFDVGPMNRRLAGSDIFGLVNKLTPKKVELFLPRFKAEFSNEINDVICRLGLFHLFSDNENFPYLLETSKRLKISNIMHNSRVCVDEIGADQKQKIETRRNKQRKNGKFVAEKVLRINKPFTFAVKDNKNIYFIGHIIKPLKTGRSVLTRTYK